jgi:hypothetical protein
VLSGSTNGGAISCSGPSLTVIDTTFDDCVTLNWGGAVFIDGPLIMIRCCGLKCTARVGTMVLIEDYHAGPHEFSQTTFHACGRVLTWYESVKKQVGGVYIGTLSSSVFNHLNQTSNLAAQNTEITDGRGAAIYGSSKAFACSWFTLVNNTGNVIVDSMTQPLTRLTYANIVRNTASNLLSVLYATITGMALNHCVFLGNTSPQLYYSKDSNGENIPFQLSHCYFDQSANDGLYNAVEDVVMNTEAMTNEIGHLDVEACPAEIPFSSLPFSQSHLFSPSDGFTPELAAFLRQRYVVFQLFWFLFIINPPDW